MAILDQEPERLVTGATAQWRKISTDYPATDGWEMAYYFRKAEGDGFNVTAEADGSDYLATIESTATESLTAGTFSWQCWVINGAVKYLVDSGKLVMSAGFDPSATTQVDGRSEVKKILDAIDAMIGKRANKIQQEYVLGNRQMKYIPIPDLIALRTQYAHLYNEEVRAERLRKGGPFFKNILVRFVEPS